MSLPTLKRDNPTLFNLYYGYQVVDSKDIRQIFNISRGRASGIVREIRAEMIKENIPFCYDMAINVIPTTRLFEKYGWDIQEITRKTKVLQKAGTLK